MPLLKKSVAAIVVVSLAIFAAAIIIPPIAQGGPVVSGAVQALQSGPWNVGITGSPNVNAAQTGAWNVGINGTPTVNSQQSGAWSVDLNGTPAVAAQQSGPWNVGLTGTADVNITNSTLPLVVPPANKFYNTHLTAIPNSANELVIPVGPIQASLISFSSMSGTALVQVVKAGQIELNYSAQDGTIVLPLSQPLTIDMLRLYCYSTSATDCSADFNVVGR